MSITSQQRNTDSIPLVGSHNRIYNISGDQYNYTIHHHHPSPSNQETVLAALKPVDRSGYYVTPCIQGTRQWILDQIYTWLNDFQAPNILWLGGSPGAGKSTIASTLVSQLAEMGRLSSHFFFKRSDVALSDPAAVWRTVASDLAQVDPVFAEKLMENVKERKVDFSRADIGLHFKYTIQDPLMESWKRHTEGEVDHNLPKVEDERPRKRHKRNDVNENLTSQPPVVVLDALDECGSDVSQSAQRRIFMDTIARWSHLHPSFKLFVTSRDQHITQSFRKACHHISLETGELSQISTSRDTLNDGLPKSHQSILRYSRGLDHP
jgi:NACHT domain